jgi:hypothetical protein
MIIASDFDPNTSSIDISYYLSQCTADLVALSVALGVDKKLAQKTIQTLMNKAISSKTDFSGFFKNWYCKLDDIFCKYELCLGFGIYFTRKQEKLKTHCILYSYKIAFGIDLPKYKLDTTRASMFAGGKINNLIKELLKMCDDPEMNKFTETMFNTTESYAGLIYYRLHTGGNCDDIVERYLEIVKTKVEKNKEIIKKLDIIMAHLVILRAYAILDTMELY